MKRTLPISQVLPWRRFPGCVLAGGTQAKPGGLPVLGKWTWESEKDLQGKALEKERAAYRENPEN